jgi:hypothetical protein
VKRLAIQQDGAAGHFVRLRFGAASAAIDQAVDGRHSASLRFAGRRLPSALARPAIASSTSSLTTSLRFLLLLVAQRSI